MVFLVLLFHGIAILLIDALLINILLLYASKCQLKKKKNTRWKTENTQSRMMFSSNPI